MPPRLQRAAWPAVVVLAVLLPFTPAVLGLRTLSYRDTDQLYAPVRTLVVEALRDLRLPLWNPYEGTGKPLFAEGIHSVLHPLSLLAAAVAPSSIDFLILAYLVAAALGAFVLARTLEASEPASAGTGLAYALSGYSVSMMGNLVFLAGLSSLPWLLAAARSAGRGDRWGTVLTALATATAFFSGDVQVALVGLALGALLAWDAGGLRGAARALVGFGPGLLLAAVQIVASYQLLPQTLRGEELSDLEKTLWALAPARLMEWVLPGLFRGPPTEIPIATSGAWLDRVFSESVYLGAPLLISAALGLRALLGSARRRTGLLLAASTLVLLWLALGHHLGARQLLDWVPVWSRFRYAEKLMAPLALCLALLAALGVDAFGAERLSSRWRRALAAGALAASLALLLLWLAPGPTAQLATWLLGDAGPFYRTRLAVGLPHLLLSLAALLAIATLRDSLRSRLLALLVPLAPAVAVYYGAHLGSRELRSAPSPLQLATDSPVPRIAHPAERSSGSDVLHDYFEVTARFQSRVLLPAVNVAHRIDALAPYGAFEPLRYTSLVEALEWRWARGFRRFGLTHVVVPIPVNVLDREATQAGTEGGQLLQRDSAGEYELWAVPHRPWAFFAARALSTERSSLARDGLLELLESGDDGTVVVEAREAPLTSPGRVLRVERGTTSLRVEAESAGPALLVVQDAWWPGWRATIDGSPAQILAADYLVRAVRWPPGRHVLAMSYDPPSHRLGELLSATGALVLLILALLALRRATDLPLRDDASAPPCDTAQ